MPVLTAIDGAALARIVCIYRDALRRHQEELNRLNVYPVPDGDTGTNMALTLESVCSEVGDATRMHDVCQALAHGSLMGARGNSGVILSQILRGLADTCVPRPRRPKPRTTTGRSRWKASSSERSTPPTTPSSERPSSCRCSRTPGS